MTESEWPLVPVPSPLLSFGTRRPDPEGNRCLARQPACEAVPCPVNYSPGLPAPMCFPAALPFAVQGGLLVTPPCCADSGASWNWLLLLGSWEAGSCGHQSLSSSVTESDRSSRAPQRLDGGARGAGGGTSSAKGCSSCLLRALVPLQVQTCVGLCKPERPAANQMTAERCGRGQGLQCEPSACTWVGSHTRPANAARWGGCQKQRRKELSGVPSRLLKRTSSCQTSPLLLGLASFLRLHLTPGTLQLASGLRGSCQPLRCRVFSWGAGEMRESCLHQGLLLFCEATGSRHLCPAPRRYSPGVCTCRRNWLLTQFESECFRRVEFAADICAYAGPEAKLHLFLSGSVGHSHRALTEFILYFHDGELGGRSGVDAALENRALDFASVRRAQAVLGDG